LHRPASVAEALHRVRAVAPSFGVATALALHLGLCLLPARAILASAADVPRFGSSDGFYHAHRIRLLFEAFPAAVFKDPSLAFPDGAIVEWPLGFDWACAATLRALGAVSGSAWGELVWYLPFLPLAFSVAAVLVFRWLASRHLGTGGAALATVAFAANLAFVGQSLLGQLDHHVAEALGVTLLLALPDVVSARGSRAASAASGVALAWLAWCSTLFAWLIGLVAFCWLLARALEREGPPLPHLPWAITTLLGLALPPVLFESGARSAWFSVSTLSVLQWCAMAVPLLLLPRARKLSPRLLLGAAVLGLAAAWIAAPEAARWAMDLLTGRDRFLSNVVEARPLFTDRDGPSIRPALLAFGAAYFTVPVLLWASRRFRTLDAVRWAAAVVLFVLSLSQKRFSHLFAPAYVLLVFSAVLALPLRFRSWAQALATVLLLVPAATYATALARYPSESTDVAWEITAELERRARPGQAVAAPPNYGNAILFRTRLPIVTNTFFYPRYLRRDLELRSFEREDELRAYLRHRGLVWLVAADDVRYRHMLLELLHRDREAGRVAPLRERPCDPALLRWAVDRLACLDTPVQGFERVRLFRVSPSRRAMVRRLVLYRVLDDGRLRLP
jgi:asparagine N-glycosylation enzyme membrane subunit Stt3